MLRGLKPGCVDIGPLLFEVTVFRSGLIIGHGEVESYGHVGSSRFDCVFSFCVGGQQTSARFFAVAHEESGKIGAFNCFRAFARLAFIISAMLIPAGAPGGLNQFRQLGNVRFIHGRGIIDEIAHMLGDLFAVAGIQIGAWGFPHPPFIANQPGSEKW